MDPHEAAADDLVLHGRVMPASNATFIGTLGAITVVYKPVAGERPLWDFPDGTLAAREVAAHAVSEALGWHIVPRTWMGDGPHGPGMLQEWQEPDEAQSAVQIVPAGEIPRGWCRVFDGLDVHDRAVTLIHEDTPTLRAMAVFDVIINNADRKGGHVLEMSDGHRYGVDHGLGFHDEPKLRTVLWGWAGQRLTEGELTSLQHLQQSLRSGSELADQLDQLITPAEIRATRDRVSALIEAGRLPHPSGLGPAIPWPPF